MGHRAGWLDPIAVGLSHAGSFGALWLGLALAATLVRRQLAILLLTTAAVAAADLAAWGLKEAVDRPRPPQRLPGLDPLLAVPGSPSFPSGHAATSFAAALVLARFLLPLAPLLALLAAAVAYSRVYGGVHYPLDALGGAGLGLLVAIALLLLEAGRRRSPRRRRPRPPTGPPPDPRSRRENRGWRPRG